MKINWRPPSLSELTPVIYDMGLTHLGYEAFHCVIIKVNTRFLFTQLILKNVFLRDKNEHLIKLNLNIHRVKRHN